MANDNFYENGYALLIGIKYDHWLNPLPSPVKDVEALEAHFTDKTKAAYKRGNIIVLKEQEATTGRILDALTLLANKTSDNPEASVIVYYSGHGGSHGGKFFLLPYDFNTNEWVLGNLDEKTIIESSEFARKISAIKAKKCMVILDCCHAENIPVEKSLSLSVANFGDFVESLDSCMEELTVPVEKSPVTRLKKGSGRVILTSCTANETSIDTGRLSLFTRVLLECLNGSGNRRNDGWVRLPDLIDYVPERVSKEAKTMYGHDQNPMFKRIENLRAEEFIICAYNIAKAKGLETGSTTTRISQTEGDLIIELVRGGAFDEAFERLDGFQLSDVFQYNRFKDEYMAGLEGVKLKDLSKKLPIFIRKEIKLSLNT